MRALTSKLCLIENKSDWTFWDGSMANLNIGIVDLARFTEIITSFCNIIEFLIQLTSSTSTLRRIPLIIVWACCILDNCTTVGWICTYYTCFINRVPLIACSASYTCTSTCIPDWSRRWALWQCFICWLDWFTHLCGRVVYWSGWALYWLGLWYWRIPYTLVSECIISRSIEWTLLAWHS